MVDGTMRYSYVRRSPMQPDIAYEEGASGARKEGLCRHIM